MAHHIIKFCQHFSHKFSDSNGVHQIWLREISEPNDLFLQSDIAFVVETRAVQLIRGCNYKI